MPVKKILTFFIVWRLTLLLIAVLALQIIPLPTFRFHASPQWYLRKDVPDYVWVWGNFDGDGYLLIADRGYRDYGQPFFPLFPITIKAFNLLTKIPLIVSGQIISNLFFVATLFLVYKLLKIDKKTTNFSDFLWILFLFPTSFFYVAIYNDSMFFFLAALTIYFARREKWIASSIAGALATLTRLNGLALFLFIIAEYLISNINTYSGWKVKTLYKNFLKKFTFKNLLKKGLLSSFLIPVAFISYLVYIQIQFGSWTRLFSSMKVWNQDKIVFPLQVFWRYFKIIFLYPQIHYVYWVSVLELLMVLFYIFFIIYSYKKIRLSYWLFMIVSLLIPASTGTFQGMPRYGLHLYPLFLAIALFFQQQSRVKKLAYFVICAILLIVLVSLFVRRYFIA